MHDDRRRARRHPEQGDGPARRSGPTWPASAGPRWPGPARSSASQQRVPRLRRLRPARGRPAAAAARGLLRAASRWRVAAAPAGAGRPRVPAARDPDLRRERRLPAPGPHHDPPGLGRGLRGGRRSGPVPRHRRAVAAAEAVLLRDVPPGPVRARCTTRCSSLGLESPYAERLAKSWRRTPTGRAREITTQVPCGDYFEVRDQALIAHATQIDPHGALVRLPDRRRSGPPGRPRTITSPGRWWILRCRRTTCSRGSGRR